MTRTRKWRSRTREWSRGLKDEINGPWEGQMELIQESAAEGHNKYVEAHMKLREKGQATGCA